MEEKILKALYSKKQTHKFKIEVNKMTSERLKLREVTKNDVGIFYAWWNDGRLMKDVGFPNGLDLSHEKVLKTIEAHIKNKTLYVIETLHDLKAIGEMSFKKEDGIRIGLKIADINAQGKGYGKEALILFVKHLFNLYQGKDIFIDTLATNNRAIQLYQSIGAKITETKKSFWTNPEGKVFDAVFFRLKENDLNV